MGTGPLSEQVVSTLRNPSLMWDQHVDALGQLSEQALSIAARSSSAELRGLLQQIRHLAPSFVLLISDLRSVLVRESCATVRRLVEVLGAPFTAAVDVHVVPALLSRCKSTKAVIRKSAHEAATALFEHGLAGISLSVVQHLTATIRNNKKLGVSLRCSAASLVAIFFRDNEVNLTPSMLEALGEAIVIGVADPDELVRNESKCTWLKLAGMDDVSASVLLDHMDTQPAYYLLADFKNHYGRPLPASDSKSSPTAPPERLAKANRDPQRRVVTENARPMSPVEQNCTKSTFASQLPPNEPVRVFPSAPIGSHDVTFGATPTASLASQFPKKASRANLRPPRRSVAPGAMSLFPGSEAATANTHPKRAMMGPIAPPLQSNYGERRSPEVEKSPVPYFASATDNATGAVTPLAMPKDEYAAPLSIPTPEAEPRLESTEKPRNVCPPTSSVVTQSTMSFTVRPKSTSSLIIDEKNRTETDKQSSPSPSVATIDEVASLSTHEYSSAPATPTMYNPDGSPADSTLEEAHRNKGRISFILGVNITPGDTLRRQWRRSRMDMSPPLDHSSTASPARSRSGSDVGLSIVLEEDFDGGRNQSRGGKRGISPPDLNSSVENTPITTPVATTIERISPPKDNIGFGDALFEEANVIGVKQHVGTNSQECVEISPAEKIDSEDDAAPIIEQSKVDGEEEVQNANEENSKAEEEKRIAHSSPVSSDSKTTSEAKPLEEKSSEEKKQITDTEPNETEQPTVKRTISSTRPLSTGVSARDKPIAKKVGTMSSRLSRKSMMAVKPGAPGKESDGPRMTATHRTATTSSTITRKASRLPTRGRPPVGSSTRQHSRRSVAPSTGLRDGSSEPMTTAKTGKPTSDAALANGPEKSAGGGGGSSSRVLSGEKRTANLVAARKLRNASLLPPSQRPPANGNSSNAPMRSALPKSVRASGAVASAFGSARSSTRDVAASAMGEKPMGDKSQSGLRRPAVAKSSASAAVPVAAKAGANATARGTKSTGSASTAMRRPNIKSVGSAPSGIAKGGSGSNSSNSKAASSAVVAKGAKSEKGKSGAGRLERLRSSLGKLRGLSARGRGDWNSRLEKVSELKEIVQVLDKDELSAALAEDCVMVLSEATNDVHHRVVVVALDGLFWILLRVEGDTGSSGLQRVFEKRSDVLRRVLHLCKDQKEDVRLAGQRVMHSFTVQFAPEVQVNLVLRAMGIEMVRARKSAVASAASGSGGVGTLVGGVVGGGAGGGGSFGSVDARAMEMGCVALAKAFEQAEQCNEGFVWSGLALQAMLVGMGQLTRDRRVEVRRGADKVVEAVERCLPDGAFEIACRKFNVQFTKSGGGQTSVGAASPTGGANTGGANTGGANASAQGTASASA